MAHQIWEVAMHGLFGEATLVQIGAVTITCDGGLVKDMTICLSMYAHNDGYVQPEQSPRQMKL